MSLASAPSIAHPSHPCSATAPGPGKPSQELSFIENALIWNQQHKHSRNLRKPSKDLATEGRSGFLAMTAFWLGETG